MYLHARMFCTLAHTTSIPVGAMYLHASTSTQGFLYTHSYNLYTCGCNVIKKYVLFMQRSVHSDTILYPYPIFAVITEVWPHANRDVVRNDSTVIIEVVL